MIDIWPYLLTALIGGITGLAGWVHNLRTRVAILEKSVENLLKRVDSHSKKQDEVLVKINSMEHQVLEKVGSVNVGMAELRSEVQALSRLISFCDSGFKIARADGGNR